MITQIPTPVPGFVSPNSLTAANFAFLQKYVYNASGIVLDQSKQYLLEARLLPLMKDAALSSLNALSELLHARPADPLGRLVMEAMTTNETLFFRDPAMFEAIRSHLLPCLMKNAGKRKLRIWSAASSTGQEAYSLAMLLLEEGMTHAEVEIVGTDLSNQVLVRAKLGCYNAFEVGRGLGAGRLARHFLAVGRDFQVVEAARRMVRFEQLDLRGSIAHLGVFDLILCRNVLIYFDVKTKRRILDSIKSAFYTGGLLTLGCGETIINVHELYQRRMVGNCTFYSAEAQEVNDQLRAKKCYAE